MEPGAAELYDQALLGILQHVGNVQDFLRVLFGFLYRKTDFYRLLRHPSDRMGFPPGAAQALVLQVFTAFEHMARQDDEKRRKELEEKARRKEAEEAEATAAEQEPVPAPGQEVEVGPGTDSGGLPGPRGAGLEVAPGSEEAEPPGAQAGAAELPEEPPALPKRQEQFQRNPDSYNGAVRENYTWSQDYTDLELKVPVPKHVVKGRQVFLWFGFFPHFVGLLPQGTFSRLKALPACRPVSGVSRDLSCSGSFTDLTDLQVFTSFGRCQPGSQQGPVWLWRQMTGKRGETVQDKCPQSRWP
ncbi:nudC domain-containing protein 3 isoform X5 [Mustela putorius furo]|uniref:NudC domain-containing protein 3 isoform X5 n=1 Tax=Mustela putorius furo TaxID=9669 RepID=A0A8U0SMH7_MUSPF|nr:nudC domain-containing protein 3 isoform X5 [Mustela putorius furo]